MKKIITGFVLGAGLMVAGPAFAIDDATTAAFNNSTVQTIFNLLNDEVLQLREQVVECENMKKDNKPVGLGAAGESDVDVSWSQNGRELTFVVAGNWDKAREELVYPNGGFAIETGMNKGLNGKHEFVMENMPAGEYRWKIVSQKGGAEAVKEGVLTMD